MEYQLVQTKHHPYDVQQHVLVNELPCLGIKPNVERLLLIVSLHYN